MFKSEQTPNPMKPRTAIVRAPIGENEEAS